MKKAIAWLVLGLLTLQVTTVASAQKAEVPAAAAIEKSKREVALLFQAEYEKAVSDDQKNKLAQQLVSVASETKDDLPGKYALLVIAGNIAVSTSNLDLGVTVIKQIDDTFIVDRHGLTVTFLGKLANSNPNTKVVQSIVDHCLTSQIELIAQDEQLVRYITRYRDVALSVLESEKAVKEIAIVKERSTYAQTTARAFLVLKADPNNGKANQLVGLHLLTNHGKMPDVIRHFLKSNNKIFRRAAELEQKTPMSFDAKTEVAEAWLQTENPYAALQADLWLSSASLRLPDSILTLRRNKALLTDLKTRVGELLPGVVDKPVVNSIGMKLTLIPAGTFMMGSPETEKDRSPNEHLHEVTISKAFYMQTTEVTQGQWKALMGTEPWKGKSNFKEGANYPAVYVSWNDAVAYCKKLSEKEGKTYRLPTEAQWEYACRAGTKTMWSFGNDEKALYYYAWYDKNVFDRGERYAPQVGIRSRNAFALYDMHGNVWEWCHDVYGEDYYKQSPKKDPTGPASGDERVLRGGSWYGTSRSTRSAYRHWGHARAVGASGALGFRLVRELD